MTNDKIREGSDTLLLDFDAAYGRVTEEINKTLSSSPVIIREYTKHLALSTGKHIRAVSLLACAIGEDDLVKEDAVKLASSIELLHLATLVHDDVIDNAEIRRGELSLQKKYGKRTAVICGDYLLCVALKTAAEVEDAENYVKLQVPDYMSRVCLGELNQHINNGNFSLTVYRYLKIIAGKTAALFEASFLAGAILSDTPKPVQRQYAKLGRYIGMIFQLTDDLMDFETTQEVAKKPVRSDYEQNVITLPLIHAFEKIAGLKEKAEQGLLLWKDMDASVSKAGGLAYTRMVAKKYYDKSTAILEDLELSPAKREHLTAILNKAFRLV